MDFRHARMQQYYQQLQDKRIQAILKNKEFTHLQDLKRQRYEAKQKELQENEIKKREKLKRFGQLVRDNIPMWTSPHYYQYDDYWNLNDDIRSEQGLKEIVPLSFEACLFTWQTAHAGGTGDMAIEYCNCRLKCNLDMFNPTWKKNHVFDKIVIDWNIQKILFIGGQPSLTPTLISGSRETCKDENKIEKTILKLSWGIRNAEASDRKRERRDDENMVFEWNSFSDISDDGTGIKMDLEPDGNYDYEHDNEHLQTEFDWETNLKNQNEDEDKDENQDEDENQDKNKNTLFEKELFSAKTNFPCQTLEQCQVYRPLIKIPENISKMTQKEIIQATINIIEQDDTMPVMATKYRNVKLHHAIGNYEEGEHLDIVYIDWNKSMIKLSRFSSEPQELITGELVWTIRGPQVPL